MKRIVLLLALLPAALNLGAQDFHSLWIIPKKTEIGQSTHFDAAQVTRTPEGWQFCVPVGRIPAGSYVEWDFTISASADAPEYYAVEYLDGRKWKTDGVFACTLTKDTSKEFTIQMRTIRLENAIDKGNLLLRLRPVTSGEGLPAFACSDNTAASVRWLGTEAPKDTTRVLCIGNSFTYVCQSSWMLKSLAWSQGHYLEVEDALKGGQSFGQHLSLSVTADKIRQGRYDFAFLQNQSQTNAWFAQKHDGQILDDALELARRVRRYSPNVRLLYESTWSYPGKKSDNGGFESLGEFDRLMHKGTSKIAKAAKARVSPIGRAFALCRAERPDIALYASDKKHQSEYGAYLKACVNYLIIFRTPFDESRPQNCSLDSEKAKYLRDIASRVVL